MCLLSIENTRNESTYPQAARRPLIRPWGVRPVDMCVSNIMHLSFAVRTMTLLSDELSVWEVSFRWAGYDPGKFRFRTPLAVKDNFRNIMAAILSGHLDCSTLSLEKRNLQEANSSPPEFFIRHYMDEVHDCVSGRKFDRKLLDWASVHRWAMHQWCEQKGIPLPDFWFPSGWKIEFDQPYFDVDELTPANATETTEDSKQRIDKRHRVEMACQQVAGVIWAKECDLTIKEVAIRKEIQEFGGGDGYELETVMQWIRDFDPRDPSQKRGRKRKNKSPPDAPENS